MRIKALRVFTGWLADDHPGLARLDQLDRSQRIEPFLAWTRTRAWRGPNGRGKTFGMTVFHHDIIDPRNFLDGSALGSVAAARPGHDTWPGDASARALREKRAAMHGLNATGTDR